MKAPLISLKDISFSYGDRKVLDSINLEIYEGERIGLIGSNGAGKTTLLYLIMGLLKPQKGAIEILGKGRTKEKDFIEVRQKIGFLFQDSDNQLFCPTVKEDIAFGPLNLGKTKKEAMEIVRETCKILGIEGFEDRVTYKLSGGEKRLVALATVIAMKPLCFILDEPSAGVDENHVKKIVKYLKNNAKTYLIASHDREFLKDTVEKIITLEKGKIKY